MTVRRTVRVLSVTDHQRALVPDLTRRANHQIKAIRGNKNKGEFSQHKLE